MRIFGIKTDISPTVLITLSSAAFILPWRWLFAILLAAAVHETGHLAALYLLKKPVKRIAIGLTGARILVGPLSLRQELLCACAGPGAAAILICMGRIYPELAICAFVQSAYNLIPLMPFDGGRIFCCLINGIFPQYLAERIVDSVEILICFAFACLGVICLLNRLFFTTLLFMIFVAMVVIRKTTCNGEASAVQ